MKKSVLVIVAHPDDEVLGCGGTIAKHIKDGDTVNVVILVEGIISRVNNIDYKESILSLSELEESARRANKILGVPFIKLFKFPDNRLDSIDLLDIIKVVETVIEEHRPDIVYTHHVGDVNIDHKRVHQAVVTACRPTQLFCVTSILFFETASSTEWQVPNSAPHFTPNYYVNISGTLNQKLDAMKEYSSEIRNWPHPRSIMALEHLARWRGATVGFDAAEAFMVGRILR